MTKINQNKIFLDFEGDNWYKRNKQSMLQFDPKNDFPIKLIELYNITPKKIIEIGCSNGYRLNYLNYKYKADCCGIDSSIKAIEDGKKLYSKIRLLHGEFSELPIDEKFDLIIVNFVFHWIDRNLLAKCVSEVERLLIPMGFLIIGDFFPDYPRKNKYHHLPQEDVWTFKQDYAKLFLSLGTYSLIAILSTNHKNKDLAIEINDDEKVSYSILIKKEM